MKIEGIGRRQEACVWQYDGLSSHAAAKSVKQGLTTGHKLSPLLSPLSFFLLYSHFICPLWFNVLVSPRFSSGVSSHLFSSVMLFTVLHCSQSPLIHPLLSQSALHSHHLRQAVVHLKEMAMNLIN